MIRKLFGSESLASSEETAVQRLADAHARLLMEGDRVNTKSEVGYGACAAFLEALDSAAKALRLEPAARGYRTNFTINYRALFPDEERNYRVDVLEASAEQSAVIWVNGEKFEFSADVMERAEALIRTWTDTCRLLERWRAQRRPGKSELRTALRLLDGAWACFEHKYIAELIQIEEKARKLVVDSIQHERAMQQMEANGVDSQQCPAYTEERSKLIRCICKLNSVANFRRKGRDDLSADILDDALALMHSCENQAAEQEEQLDLSAARCLAVDVVESYWHMRYYLRDISHCLERVDPHLCNNAGLVSRLVDWEESWEVGCKYVQNAVMLRAVCHMVGYLKGVEKLEEGLSKMMADCDVEFCLSLPRLVWLRFLTDPARHYELLRSFLPHRFSGETSASSGSSPEVSTCVPPPWDNDVQDVIELHSKAYEVIREQFVTSDEFPPGVAVQRFLVQRVVAGPNCEDFYKSLDSGLREPPNSAVEDLMHEIEKKSIELQRHCPEDWNQYMALLVQCFVHGQQKPRQHHFRV